MLHINLKSHIDFSDALTKYKCVFLRSDLQMQGSARSLRFLRNLCTLNVCTFTTRLLKSLTKCIVFSCIDFYLYLKEY